MGEIIHFPGRGKRREEAESAVAPSYPASLQYSLPCDGGHGGRSTSADDRRRTFRLASGILNPTAGATLVVAALSCPQKKRGSRRALAERDPVSLLAKLL